MKYILRNSTLVLAITSVGLLNADQKEQDLNKLYVLIKNKKITYDAADKEIKALKNSGFDINQPFSGVNTGPTSVVYIYGNPTISSTPLIYAAAQANEVVFNALANNGASITSPNDPIWNSLDPKIKNNFRELRKRWLQQPD